MYARLIFVNAGPGKRAEVAKIADQMQPLIASLKGFVRLTFLVDEANGEYGILQLWETKAASEAADAIYSPKAQELWATVSGAGSRQIREFEVYEPAVAVLG